ncbi:MAG: iron-sulfur cluster assembly scaffold protein [Ectothiorhodospiraceae bacterium AqS1]|nr:iron-sulfur cluster assembly scaffold protein [Ectothiorhodospiraceae bacterium AqS1]
MSDLYQAAMIETARRGSGRGRLAEPDTSAAVDNPLCGDRVIVDIRIEEIAPCDPPRDSFARDSFAHDSFADQRATRRLIDLGHEVRGCLLCEAAAVILAERAPGQAIESLLGLHRTIESALRSGSEFPWPTLDIFSPVAAVKSRHRCITLPFEALHEALTMAMASADSPDSSLDSMR